MAISMIIRGGNVTHLLMNESIWLWFVPNQWKGSNSLAEKGWVKWFQRAKSFQKCFLVDFVLTLLLSLYNTLTIYKSGQKMFVGQLDTFQAWLTSTSPNVSLNLFSLFTQPTHFPHLRKKKRKDCMWWRCNIKWVPHAPMLASHVSWSRMSVRLRLRVLVFLLNLLDRVCSLTK